MQLTRRHVVATAMKLIEADGVEAVTMNRLATELGCGLLALYRLIPSRSALLDRVADTVTPAAELRPGGPEQPHAGADWTGQLRAWAIQCWQAGRSHPRCAVAVAGRPPATASQLRPVEHALTALSSGGVAGRQAVATLRALRAYVAGSLLCETGMAPGHSVTDATPHLRTAEFPRVTDLAAELARRDPEADFRFGLDLLITAIGTGMAGPAVPEEGQ